jgi:hypothetical protein
MFSLAACGTTGQAKDLAMKKGTEEGVPGETPQVEAISVVDAGGDGTVRTGEAFTVEVEAENYTSLSYKFGAERGAQEQADTDNSHSFSRFGVKTVTVVAEKGEYREEKTFRFPVVGEAEVRLDKHELQHSKKDQALVRATIEGNGSYDTVKVFYKDRVVFEAPRQVQYQCNIPFVGKKTFYPRLFEENKKVAETNSVTITGLNKPPERKSEFSKVITGQVGEPVTFDLSEAVYDPNSDTLLFEMKYAPPGATVGKHSGEFSWTPQSAGLYIIDFFVYDFPYRTGEIWLQRLLRIR